ncbi:MAG: recombinase family protein [Firmicutes bacterium]|nr:recombinase family protein [Bacillota bacterium]
MTIVNFRTPRASSHNKKYAVALCRVSTEDQFTKGLSIPEQRERIQKWADKNNITVLKWEEISHSAYRGMDEDPRVLDLIEFAKTNDSVSYFLVDEKSRFARRKYLRVVWQEDLRKHGVQVVGVSEPQYDRNSIHGIWLEGISETKDEARSIETAYHTTKGMMRNAATRDPETGYCYKNGGIAPDGYQNQRVIRGKDSRGKDIIKLLWEVCQERAKIIRYIVLDLWMKKRMSYREIRDHLNSNELKFNGTSKPILNSKNKPWSTTTIREICMRALEGVYSGIYYWNRTGRNLRGTGEKWKDEDDWVLIEDAHPAIINNTEWEELKTTMGPIVQKRKNPNARTNRSEDSQYLFSGNNAAGEPMFICMHCGGSINGQQVAKHLYYLCANYKNKGKAGCSKGVAIKKDELEIKVLKSIKSRFTPQKIKLVVKEINNILNENNKDLKKAETYIKKTILEAENSINNIMNAIQQGKGSKTIPFLLEQMEKLQDEKQSLENELDELKREQPEVKKLDEATVLAQVQNLETILLSPKTPNREKRMAIRYFIRQLRFDPDKGEVHIYFWPDPTGSDKELLKLIKVNEQIRGSSATEEVVQNKENTVMSFKRFRFPAPARYINGFRVYDLKPFLFDIQVVKSFLYF